MNPLSTLLPLAVNIALPLLIYHYAVPHCGESNALILSSVPPVLWSVIELARFRRLDAISLPAVLGIFLSLAGIAFGGSPRLCLTGRLNSSWRFRPSSATESTSPSWDGRYGVLGVLKPPARRGAIFVISFLEPVLDRTAIPHSDCPLLSC